MAGTTAKTTGLGNTKIMIVGNSKSFAAISYDTQTFFMLSSYLDAEGAKKLHRIEPEDFLKNPSTDFQYINLVVKDFDLRKQISKTLDNLNLDRFTYINTDFTAFTKINIAKQHFKIGPGCMIYPGVWIYSGNIGKDVVIHSMVRLAENIQIDDGSFLSGSITIAGDCRIGKNCYLGTNVLLYDHVTICDDVKLLPGVNIRKNINHPGTYYNPTIFDLKRFP